MADSFLNDGTLELLMYLDEGLVKNLSSLVLSGYIEIRTTRLIQDKTLSERIGAENKNHSFGEDRGGCDVTEGFRRENDMCISHNEESCNNNMGAENRDFIRREEELKRIYTTFNLHGQLFDQLDRAHKIVRFDNTTVHEGEVKVGDYIRMRGYLTSESINSYIESLEVLFDCFGCDKLNSIIPNKLNGIINFGSICKMIGKLKEILARNDTQDLILKCGETSVIINVNNNFFMNNNSYIYDRIDCPCSVFGKVLHVAKDGECISLLRKTSQELYYENVIKSFQPYCDMLTSSGLIVPSMPRLKCDGISMIVLPISIST